MQTLTNIKPNKFTLIVVLLYITVTKCFTVHVLL